MEIPKFTWKPIDHIDNKDDDAIDVEIILEDGSRYVPTFFTLKRLTRLMQGYRKIGVDAEPGEETMYANGVYFWDHDMVIVHELTAEAIEATVRDLLGNKTSLDHVFRQIPEYNSEVDEDS